ncbi:hypothetical protein [Arthrobacter rhombi]|uniref:hypothetical protein n=1 Tax=Arthrobacter rhombi TaxID=71253 RepID=UPI003569F48F
MTAEPSGEVPENSVPSPTSTTDERGQLVKKVGQSAGIGDSADDRSLEFTVTGFEFVKCTNAYAGKLNGRALAVHIEVQTSADFEGPLEVDGASGKISFGAEYWNGYQPDGTRMNDLNSDTIQNCMNSRGALLPEYIGKGEKAKGTVLLDVTSKSGEVAFVPYGEGGWVWKYPAKKAPA